MARLRIETLYDGAWKIFGFQYDQLIRDRDRFLARLERRLGHGVTAEIQRHVEAALGRRLPCPDMPKPEIMTKREYYDLLAIESSIEEIEQRIDSTAVFFDTDHGLLSTLGLCWRHDILRLLDGQKSPGYMPLKNIKKFLVMVRERMLRFVHEDGIDDDYLADHYRKWRQELIEFLERAVKIGKPLYCAI
jgi:hypothetical protein